MSDIRSSANPPPQSNDKRNILNFFKNATMKLKAVSPEFEERIGILCVAWRNAHSLVEIHAEESEKVINWVICHTLESMLMAKWSTIVKEHLNYLKNQIILIIPKLQTNQFQHMRYRCNYIINNIDDPWGQETLCSIINCKDGENDNNTKPTEENLKKDIEYFESERGCMIDMRLRKLVESKCDDLAIRFCRRALQAIRVCGNNHPLRQTVSVRQHQSILETYFSLLVKFKKINDLKNELELMDYETVAEFILYHANLPNPINGSTCENENKPNSSINIEQEHENIESPIASPSSNVTTYSLLQQTPSTSSSSSLASCNTNRLGFNENTQNSRLQKYSVKANELALQLFILRILGDEKFTEISHKPLLQQFLNLWIHQHKDNTNFDHLFKKMIANSRARPQMYISCEILYNYSPNYLDLTLQIFCLALTQDINMLEDKKYDESVDATIIIELEKQTSHQYLFLGRVLSNYPELKRECILTAFSMNPTFEKFNLICELAEMMEYYSTPNKDYSDQYEHENSIQSLDALHAIVGTKILSAKDYDASKAPSRLLDSLTFLSESVRHDLACLLNVPRLKNLSWLSTWDELKRECVELLSEEKKKKIVENYIATANDNLRFIKLNYDEYKDFRPHVYPGIEKGYEVYVQDTDSSESIIDNASEATLSADESKVYKAREAKRKSAKRRRQIIRSQKLQSKINIRPEQIAPENKKIIKRKRKPEKVIANIDPVKEEHTISERNSYSDIRRYSDTSENEYLHDTADLLPITDINEIKRIIGAIAYDEIQNTIVDTQYDGKGLNQQVIEQIEMKKDEDEGVVANVQANCDDAEPEKKRKLHTPKNSDENKTADFPSNLDKTGNFCNVNTKLMSTVDETIDAVVRNIIQPSDSHVEYLSATESAPTIQNDKSMTLNESPRALLASDAFFQNVPNHLNNAISVSTASSVLPEIIETPQGSSSLVTNIQVTKPKNPLLAFRRPPRKPITETQPLGNPQLLKGALIKLEIEPIEKLVSDNLFSPDATIACTTSVRNVYVSEQESSSNSSVISNNTQLKNELTDTRVLVENLITPNTDLMTNSYDPNGFLYNVQNKLYDDQLNIYTNTFNLTSTNDYAHQARSHGLEILTKHCTVNLTRIEDDIDLHKYIYHYSSGEESESGSYYSTDTMHSQMDFWNESIETVTVPGKFNFLDESMQPAVVLEHLNEKLLNKYGIKYKLQFKMNAGIRDTDEDTIDSKCTAESGFTTDDSLPLVLKTNKTFNGDIISSHAQINDSAEIISDIIMQPKNCGNNNSDNTPEDDEEDDDDRQLINHIDNYNSLNNQNGHNNDDDDDYSNGNEETNNTCLSERLNCNQNDQQQQYKSEQNGQRNGTRQQPTGKTHHFYDYVLCPCYINHLNKCYKTMQKKCNTLSEWQIKLKNYVLGKNKMIIFLIIYNDKKQSNSPDSKNNNHSINNNTNINIIRTSFAADRTLNHIINFRGKIIQLVVNMFSKVVLTKTLLLSLDTAKILYLVNGNYIFKEFLLLHEILIFITAGKMLHTIILYEIYRFFYLITLTILLLNLILILIILLLWWFYSFLLLISSLRKKLIFNKIMAGNKIKKTNHRDIKSDQRQENSSVKFETYRTSLKSHLVALDLFSILNANINRYIYKTKDNNYSLKQSSEDKSLKYFILPTNRKKTIIVRMVQMVVEYKGGTTSTSNSNNHTQENSVRMLSSQLVTSSTTKSSTSGQSSTELPICSAPVTILTNQSTLSTIQPIRINKHNNNMNTQQNAVKMAYTVKGSNIINLPNLDTPALTNLPKIHTIPLSIISTSPLNISSENAKDKGEFNFADKLDEKSKHIECNKKTNLYYQKNISIIPTKGSDNKISVLTTPNPEQTSFLHKANSLLEKTSAAKTLIPIGSPLTNSVVPQTESSTCVPSVQSVFKLVPKPTTNTKNILCTIDTSGPLLISSSNITDCNQSRLSYVVTTAKQPIHMKTVESIHCSSTSPPPLIPTLNVCGNNFRKPMPNATSKIVSTASTTIMTTATTTSIPLNQIVITFPTNSLNTSNKVLTNDTNNGAKDVTHTHSGAFSHSHVARGGSDSKSNIDKSTLEQLKEFDLVLEQFKERSVATTITATTSIPIFSSARSDSLPIPTFSAANPINNKKQTQSLFQKFNLAIIKQDPTKVFSHNSATGQVELSKSDVEVTPIILTTKNVNLLNKNVSLDTEKSDEEKDVNLQNPLSISIPATVKTSPNRSKFLIKDIGTTSTMTTLVQRQNSNNFGSASKQYHKLQEDEHTVQRIYDILANYAEQINSSPDLNNKPAPRRRSNLSSGTIVSKSSTITSTSSSELTTNSVAKSCDEPITTPQAFMKRRQKNVSATDVLIQSNEVTSEADVLNEKRRRIEITDKSNIIQINKLLSLNQTKTVQEVAPNVITIPMNNNKSFAISTIKNSEQFKLTTENINIQSHAQKNKSDTIKLGIVNKCWGSINNSPTAILIPGNCFMPMRILKCNQPNVNHVEKQTMNTQEISQIGSSIITTQQNLTTIQEPNKVQPLLSKNSVITSNQSPNSVSRPTTTVLLRKIPTDDAIQINAIKHNFTSQAIPIKIFDNNKKTILLSTNNLLRSKNNSSVGVASPSDTSININTTSAETLATSVMANSIHSISSTKSRIIVDNSVHFPNKMLKSNEISKLDLKDNVVLNNIGKEPSKKPVSLTLNSITNCTSAASMSNFLSASKSHSGIENEFQLQKSLSEECEDLGVDQPSASDLFPEAALTFDNNSPFGFEITKISTTEKDCSHQSNSRYFFNDDIDFLKIETSDDSKIELTPPTVLVMKKCNEATIN